MKDNKDKIKENNLLYVGLITLVWLITYIVCNIVWKEKLGWDEVAYMSVAKGIATDFDFSARAYTIMGLLKHGYPTNLINFPIYPIYLAIFFKLFGASMYVAYFSTWLCALAVCLLIYFIFLMLSDNDYKTSFIASLSYLLCPGTIRNCDTAMMEQAGCLLLCLFLFLILRDYLKGSFNYLTILKFSVFFLLLWLYKSLFLGIFFGAFIFICLAYNSRLTGKKINTKIPLIVFLLLSYSLFVILFYIAKKFVFLAVSPMLTFTPNLEYSQVYASFSEALLKDFPKNIFANIYYFFQIIIAPFFVYPNLYSPKASAVLPFTSYMVYVGVYFFLFFMMIALSFAAWKKLSPIEKLFLCFTFVSIIGFNLVFNFLFSTTIENVWRYNVYYLPLYLCSLLITLKSNYEYLKPFNNDHPVSSKALLFLIFIFCYLPISLSMINIQSSFWDAYHNRAKMNTEIVKSVVQNSKDGFIYFNDGTHVTWEMYPMKQIFKDATNEQLLQVNQILPKPVEYLFLKSSDWLFKNNQDLILKGESIINGEYKFLGVNNQAQLVVYKLNK